MPIQYDQLSKRDLVELTSLSYHSLACQNHEDLKRLVLDLQNVFDFDNTLYAHANLPCLFSADTKRQPVEAYNISFPQDFVHGYITKRIYLVDAAFRKMIDNDTPVNTYMPVSNYDTSGRCNKSYVSFIKKMRLTSANTWMHGVRDVCNQDYVGFAFVSPNNKNGKRVSNILKYIIPFYSEAFYRITKKEKRDAFDLTSREIEILQWIKEGKSSWEISVMLNCSKRTVDFHFENAKVKLNAVSRPQAIAIALHNEVIAF